MTSFDERVALLRRLYDAFNARDVDGVLSALADDVDWPNMLEGTTLHGHEAVRSYWQAQFDAVDPRVEPLAFERTENDAVAVSVHQVVRSLDGEVRSDTHVTHTYDFRNGEVVAMTVGPPRTEALVPPTFEDVLAARDRIRPHLPPTLLQSYAPLSALVGTETWVKHENHLPTGAFKVRGGVNFVSQLNADERRRGLITASTGNHGQSIAYAAGTFGVTARICVPEGANPLKLEAIRSFGAEIVVHGRDFDEAREHCAALAEEHGYRYVHSGNEPHLIAGVGTATLEILDDQPELDVLIVPIGGGSGAAGACIAGKHLRPELTVIGVQSEAAPAAFRSWKERRLREDEMRTFAEGLATRVAFELPQRILWEHLDDFVLVSEHDLRVAIVHLLETARTVAEPAGAAALAAALKLRDRLAGKRVGLMVSGGNITLAQLRDVLAAVP